jgi:translation initiation factor 2 beta subunit (eIF-2beta)/eIF-5
LDAENFQNNGNFSRNSQNFASFWLKFQKEKMGKIILQKRLISQQISMKMTRFSKTLVFLPRSLGACSLFCFSGNHG